MQPSSRRISPSGLSIQNWNTYTVKICYYSYNHFTTLCPGLPRWVGTRRINHSGFCWSRHDEVAVASAEPHASYLRFALEDYHASTSSVRFLWAGCPSWHPPNSVKALNARKHWRTVKICCLCDNTEVYLVTTKSTNTSHHQQRQHHIYWPLQHKK